jgi:hypothetical protein
MSFPAVALARGGHGGHHGGSHHSATAGSGHRGGGHHKAAGVTHDRHGRIKRSAHAKSAFRHSHRCPSTGRTTGACPGYVIDHIRALKHGGADDPSNMEWQTIESAKQKDKWEQRDLAPVRHDLQLPASRSSTARISFGSLTTSTPTAHTGRRC